MKVSVVIPTYNHCEDLLKPCLESLKANTDLTQTEIIVVANGCKDNTKEYVESLGEPFNLVWFDEGMGYTKSTNAGIVRAAGDYIILLNNDTVIYPPFNKWVDILLEPFSDSTVGMTGPMLTHCPEADRDFLIGFCVCIKREMFDRFGILDEIFSPGYGEDTDFCCKIQDAGFKIIQVCPSNTYANDNSKQMVGQFPIFHKGNVTFKNWTGGEELLKKNNEILRTRYNSGAKKATSPEVRVPATHLTEVVDIERAKLLDGFMSEIELKWLATEAKKRKVIIEVGSWHGKSSRALGDNSMEGGVVYCVDTWNGSVAEQNTNHASAKMRDGDHAIYEFFQGNIDLVSQGKIIPIRMSSKNAADFFKEKGLKADMIFIDAGHTEEELTQDIKAWGSVLADGGIFCGHDLGAWEGVNKAVYKCLENVYCGDATTIWYCEKKDIKQSESLRPPCIFDCFPFNNELDILERRLTELYSTVDRFVIVEALFTHANKPKDLTFHNNLNRFSKYLDKITYLVVEKFPDTSDAWALERYQRNFIMNGLVTCQDNDIIVVSDCDEIPTPEAIKSFKPEDGIRSLEMDLYYYDEHTRAKDMWFEGKILTYKKLKELTPCGARYSHDAPQIPNAGKHLSYFGDVTRIIKKIEDTAHQEYNKPEFKNPVVIAQRIANGEDVFGRNLKYEKV
ncbi:Glycosyltransferase family 17 [uncultured archaeon]|nr:Glycosyltransferase family 17 [uncultured archaeon]